MSPALEPSWRPDEAEPAIVATPHCELGCAATALMRHGIDLVRDVVGAEWSLEVATRRLSTIPQPFLDRTDVAFSAQGRGWKEVAGEVADVTIRDHIADRANYLTEVTDALTRGGAVLLVDDSQVPWLSHAAWSHGLLPHALAVWTHDLATEATTVVEGHSWWQGVYRMTYQEIMAAAFPQEDVHGIAGRYLSFDVADAAPEAERLRRATLSLLASARRVSAEPALETTVMRTGTVSIATGGIATDLAIEAYGGLRYVCQLAERSDRSPDMIRDLEFGRYTFVRLAEELAFAAFARAATRTLLQDVLGATDPACQVVAEVAHAWRNLWRSAEVLAAQLSTDQLDDVLHEWRAVTEADLQAAQQVVDAVKRCNSLG
jgi:hypothetical protein